MLVSAWRDHRRMSSSMNWYVSGMNVVRLPIHLRQHEAALDEIERPGQSQPTREIHLLEECRPYYREGSSGDG